MPAVTRSARKKKRETSEDPSSDTETSNNASPTNMSSDPNMEGEQSSHLLSSGATEINGNGLHPDNSSRAMTSVRPLSSQMIRTLSGLCCQECSIRSSSERWDEQQQQQHRQQNVTDSERTNQDILQALQSSVVSPLVLQPMLMPQSLSEEGTVEKIIGEYIASCKFYGCGDRVNAGVLTTLRFSLPALRVSGSFHDADMLALGEVLFRHCNGALKYIKRLDFSVASKEGKANNGKCGFQSHGAFTLSKILQTSQYIEEVFLQRNRIGPYGASAIFLGVSTNSTLRVLHMRGCRAKERGAMAFAEYVCRSKVCQLEEADLSANRIGFPGTKAIETEVAKRSEELGKYMHVDLEGNHVFQEVMNGVTHGLGIVLAILGYVFLSLRVQGKPFRNVMSCNIYSTSLLVLYTSSTLYHSFFSLQTTKYIFEVFDKCAIYVLIAGSYTPMCQIVLKDQPQGFYLLLFIWVCSIAGILVEALAPTWKHKLKFSLAMYLGTGWAAIVCLPGIIRLVPQAAINLLVLGGVSYTVGVPFFVRNHNLDHSIWHMFVLAASMFHWFGIYKYVATMD